MAQLARFSPAAVVERITRGGGALAEPNRTIDEIVTEATRHRPNLNATLIRRAYETAAAAHEGQMRSSGEPYITHPAAVTHYLATLQMDAETLAAALLHDVPEDTDFTIADIEKAFGREVVKLVDGVTKLSKFGSARTMEEQQAENIRKMFMAMAEDVRVVIIKLADRLHNMRTLQHLPADKQERIARQTMEIYAPLAHRLGMWQIKWELEDLAFKYLEADKYRQLVEMLTDRRRAREGFVNKSIGILRKELEKVDISAQISGRPKHLYSISKKMERKGAEFTEIYDLNAIRVLVDDVKDCYAALGIVHSLWRPVPGQFDDYIAMPKANMYQSLHTAVIGPEAKPLEVQIRTYQMHEVSEAGIAAHWRYKEGSRGDRKYDEKLAWVRQLMDWQREVSDPTEFVEGLKLDVFQDQVFVFTPKGDVKDLPRDATPLDFAYRIHTDVGHRTIGAKVNNRLVPLDYRLRNGDIVEIVTTKAAHETLASVDAAKLTEIAQQYKLRELDDFYAAIGYGAISSASVVSKLEIHDDAAITLPEEAPPAAPSTTGVKVKGVGDLLVRFAKCCSPIPGDEITGYVTRGKGVTVHRSSCPSVLSERDIERLIDVEWESADQQTYPITVRITALDRPGLLNEVTNVVAEHKVNIVAAAVATHPDGTATITATFKVTSLQQLAKVLAKIERLRDITSVTREAR